MEQLISIITINYNSLEDTISFLESIKISGDFSILEPEVIVVDNASDVDPSEALARYPWVKLVKSPKNLGFAAGNNLGIKESTGEYVFMINNDAELNLLDLEDLLVQYNAHPEYGILTPVIRNEDRSIQYAGYTSVNTLTGRNELIDTVPGKVGIVETSYPHGAAMLISRENIKKVGMMSENYFLYYEELDWGTQVRKAGLKVGVCLSSEIIHKESASVGKVSECKLYFMTRNRILFARKNFTAIHRLGFVLFFLLVSTPKNVLSFLIRKDLNGIRTYMEAVLWHFKNNTSSKRLGYKFDMLLK